MFRRRPSAPTPRSVVMVVATRGLGGTGTVVAEWSELLVGAGVDVRLVSLTDGDPSTDSAATAEAEAVAGPFTDLGHRGLRDAVRTALRLRRVIRSQPTGAVHGFLFVAEFYVRLATIGTGVRRVATITSSRGTSLSTTTRRGRLAERVRNSPTRLWTDRWVTVGEVVRTNAIAAGIRPEQAYLVHNGFSAQTVVDDSGNQRGPFPDLADRCVVLSTGRLDSGKRVDYLVRALAHLAERYVLVVAGTGPDEHVVRGEAERLGVADRVVMLGLRADVPWLLEQADVYATATEFEGMVGYSTLEAAAMGVPIAAPRLAEIMEVFDDQSVEFFDDPDDPASIARSVERIATSDTSAMTAAARSQVDAAFDATRIVEQLCEVYGFDVVSHR